MTRGNWHTKPQGKTYHVWYNMLWRCSRKSGRMYELYASRGIKVCDRWQNYQSFVEDMGEKPDGKSLDRIDNDGNYEPSNCRWSTQKEQMNNTRKTIYIEYDGQVHTLSEWADILGLNRDKIRSRVRRNKPLVS